ASPRPEIAAIKRDPALLGNLACKGKRFLKTERDRLFGFDHSFEETEFDLIFDIADGKRTNADSFCRIEWITIGIDGQSFDAGRGNGIDVGRNKQVIAFQLGFGDHLDASFGASQDNFVGFDQLCLAGVARSVSRIDGEV
ncbi:hypothetical protein, partial [Mesorhizobium sp. M7A.F.Ca.US.014.04.1.1]|uniref:hypothetical protein n=1 Tax=Mesorhizobium sp. M7A.F.Ca.US.014.04.1.1 TaxID=2496744 RepID=UPI0013DF5728